MIRKFWNIAIWSNFSAQMPPISPIVPRIALPRTAKARIQPGAANDGGANTEVTSSTPVPTIRPRATAAST